MYICVHIYRYIDVYISVPQEGIRVRVRGALADATCHPTLEIRISTVQTAPCPMGVSPIVAD